MADTTFIDRQTPIVASWLNDVNTTTYGVVNVKHYGAVGDSVTDDTAALDAAAAQIALTGGTLEVPPGTYRHDGAWVITGDNIELVGHGYSSCIVNTDTTTDGSFTVQMVGDNCTARNFRIDGKKADITATLTTRTGLRMEGDYATAEGVFVHDTLTAAMSIGFGRGAKVRGCTVYDIGYVSGHLDAGGIIVSTSRAPSIVGNTVYSTARSGIFTYECTRVTMTGNTVDTCENGLRLDAVDKDQDSFSVISGNVATNGTGDGIRFTGSRVAVTGNVCYGNAGSGAVSGGGSDQTVTGNTFIANTTNGLRVGEEDGPSIRLTIAGNNCSGNTGNGIHFTNTTVAITDAVITGNNLLGNGDRPLRLTATSAASTLVLADNNWPAGNVPQLSYSGWSVSRPGPSHNSTAAASTITLYGDGYHGISGTADINTITAMPAGNAVILYFVGTAATNGLVDAAGNLRLAGNFAYAPNASIHLVSNGTNWIEVSRSLN